MARQPRIDVPGLVYHVITRSVEGRVLFRDRRDYDDFFRRVARLVEESGVRVYAWCLMGDHTHLLLRTAGRPLAWLMRRLLTGYAVAHNLRHGLGGHLFGRRYQSLVVEEEPHFLDLVRYIHLNPVRAGVVRELATLDGYPLTGHQEILQPGTHPWQDVGGVLERFSDDPKQALRLYRYFIAAGFDQGRVEEYASRPAGRPGRGPASQAVDGQWTRNHVLGSPQFAEEVLARTDAPRPRAQDDALLELASQVAAAHGMAVPRLLGPSRERAVARARRQFLLRAVEEAGASCAQLARLCGRDHSGILRAVAKAREEAGGR